MSACGGQMTIGGLLSNPLHDLSVFVLLLMLMCAYPSLVTGTSGGL